MNPYHDLPAEASTPPESSAESSQDSYNEPSTEQPNDGAAIAIIGMGCRYPGAADPDAFWENIKNGVNCITRFSESQLLEAGVDPALCRNPAYVPARGVLAFADQFDADFFGFSPREAEITDVQHRIFLECAWEALESGGYPAEDHFGTIGVFAGSDMSTYFLNQVYPNLAGTGSLHSSVAHYQALLGADKDFLPTLVSYKLNLKGPSVCVQTACSSSLVAVHLACQSLLAGECDMALAGGVGVYYPQERGYLYETGMILSPDGVCRPFDADARGTVPGNGCGVVLLKPLNEAVADGDTVLAVIRGSAINNDGAVKAGFTAPGVAGQASAIAEAHALAGVTADRITYVEAHGTGTTLGDPIEIQALTDAFYTDRRNCCAIGSAKGNIGHTGAASGVAGLIKTVQAIRFRMIPPSLHFRSPNPAIDFDNSPFFVNTELREWDADGGPLYAGVSSFGIGGTNAHVVVGEPPKDDTDRKRPEKGGLHLFTLSAKNGESLERMTTALADDLTANPEIDPSDVAYTLQVGRKSFSHRRCVVAPNLAEAVDALRRRKERGASDGVHTAGTAGAGAAKEHEDAVVFMFPGQGAQYVGMGRGLYESEPVFRETLDHCAAIFRDGTGGDLMAALYPADGAGEAAARRLQGTGLAQPAIFAVSYATARFLIDIGIRPAAMIGHSIGEYVAASLAEVFSLEDAVALVAIRGALMAAQPPGAMTAVMMRETELKPLLARPNFAGLSLAAVNAPALCTVSGETRDIDTFEAYLAKIGASCRRLHTSHAFHSAMMEPVVERFINRIRNVTRNVPEIPFISNLTGTWITPEEATSPDYWTRHLRQPVRFADGLETLLAKPDRILLEVGPGRTLSTFARSFQQIEKDGRATVFQTMRHPEETIPDAEYFMNAVSRLWTAGVAPDWHQLRGGGGRRIPLPTYPFLRKRYVMSAPRTATAALESAGTPSKKRDISEWFYVPSWKRTPLPSPSASAAQGEWLIFEDDAGLARRVSSLLADGGDRITLVRSGSAFARNGEGEFTINPQSEADYGQLIAALQGEGRIPERIAHFWSLIISPGAGESSGEPDTSSRSMIFLARALADANVSSTVSIAFITNGLHEVTGDEPLAPAETATAMGPVRVIPQEYPNIHCRAVDVSLPLNGKDGKDGETIPERLAEQVAAELHILGGGTPPPLDITAGVVTAYRGRYRWVQSFERLPLQAYPRKYPRKYEDAHERTVRIRRGGVYFITGGLGKIGLLLAAHLTENYGAKVALMARSAFPEPSAWDDWPEHKLDRHGVPSAYNDNLDDPAGRQVINQNINQEINQEIKKIAALKQITEKGGEVLVLQGDVANTAETGAALERTEKAFGPINGVIHAAGATSAATMKTIHELTSEDWQTHFGPKIDGVRKLAELLRERRHKPDFCLLMSSLSSVLGGLGFCAYAAANSFMDAFAERQNRQSPGCRWLSAGWDGWNLGDVTEVGVSLADLAIEPAEGMAAFDRLLSTENPGRIIISTGDLDARIRRWITPRATQAAPGDMTTGEGSPRDDHDRPEIAEPYEAPRTEPERIMAGIFGELLGIRDVGVNDNFFDLGGHSLLATQASSRIQAVFGVTLPIKTLFENPTPAKLAEAVAARTLTETAPDEMADLLDRLEGMDDAEAAKRLLEMEKPK